MIIRTSGDETDAALGEGVRQNGCVFNDLRLICLELITHGFLEADCLTGNDMHERAALRSRENGAVYLLFKLVLAEDYGPSRTSEGLMGGAGDDIGIRHGARVHARCDKAADVRHVDHEVCADLIGYLTHLGKVNEAGICACTCNYELGLTLAGYLHRLFIVDALGLGVNAVKMSVKVFAGNGGFRAVGQVTAVTEIHAKDGVAGL